MRWKQPHPPSALNSSGFSVRFLRIVRHLFLRCRPSVGTGCQTRQVTEMSPMLSIVPPNSDAGERAVASSRLRVRGVVLHRRRRRQEGVGASRRRLVHLKPSIPGGNIRVGRASAAM